MSISDEIAEARLNKEKLVKQEPKYQVVARVCGQTRQGILMIWLEDKAAFRSSWSFEDGMFRVRS